MAYASPSDLTARFDETIVKDLASDTGEPVANITLDVNVLAALNDASGEIDAAVTNGNAYSATDLTAMTGTSLSLLKMLTCRLAMMALMDRRQDPDSWEKLAKLREGVEEYLDKLRRGERVFGIPANRAAGLVTVDGPSASKYRDLNLIPDRTRNFYPQRQSRLPLGR